MGVFRRLAHAWRWIVGGIVLLACAAMIAPPLLDAPLRRRIETSMNASLKGYTVHIAAVHFHPLSWALDLVDWTIVQDANPTPPLGEVPRLTASVQWRALLNGRLVADFRIERPTLHLDPEQGAHEVNHPIPVAERGRSWQRAFEQIYPLKINEIVVVDGDMTYTPGDDFKPLQMTHVNLRAGNIRTVESSAGVNE